MTILFKGHSGCKIEAIPKNGTIIVRKTSSSQEYNSRLEAQCKKQSAYVSDVLRVAQVRGEGYIGTAYYFDMDYINGKSLSEYMESIKLCEIQNLAKVLLSSVSEGEYDKNAKEVFLKKINSVVDTIINRQGGCDCELADAVSRASEILRTYQWDCIVPSPCHGDFTLENMIVADDGSLWLIDFLDSFYDSWMIDVAKILQDVELLWSYRYSSVDNNLFIRLTILRCAIIEKISAMPDGEEMLDATYHILLLNILRIVPYAHDDVTIEYLINAINRLCNKLERGILI